jgi:hypothetical protein
MAKSYLDTVLDGIGGGAAGVLGFSLIERNWSAVILSGVIVVLITIFSYHLRFKK